MRAGAAAEQGPSDERPQSALHDATRLLVARVGRGGLFAFAIHVLGAGLTYCSQVVIARFIGAHSYGVYAYVLAWATVLAYFAALGFDVSILRFVPSYHAQQAWALVRGVIRYANGCAAVVGSAIALVGVVVVGLSAARLNPELTNTFFIGLVLIPIWALLWIRSSVVRAFGVVATALAPDRIVRDGMLLVLVALAGLSFGRIDAVAAMAANVVASAFALALVTFSMRRLRSRTGQDDVLPAYATSTWRQTALPLVAIMVAEVLMNRTGVILLGWLGDTKDAGIYALAFNIAFLVVLPRTAVNALLAPAISNLFARSEHAALQALIARAAVWTLIGAACIALFVSLLADPLLRLFGRDFSEGVSTLRILLVGQVFAAGAGSQLRVMTMTGHERSAAIQVICSAAANMVLSIVLVGPIGQLGPAVATTATLIAWNAAMALYIWRRLDLMPGALVALQSVFRAAGLSTRCETEGK